MEEAKNERAKKARLVTRRINELINCIKSNPPESEVSEKIYTLKYAKDELGIAQDDVIANITEEGTPAHTLRGVEEQWYYKYDIKVNATINDAKKYIRENK